ncbi:hypothetical protein F4803DRAFT_555712 [Xylaria telfairii]|nr:hypothetical protein F4803DRAFT_555712 [Xylaria telfairii]
MDMWSRRWLGFDWKRCSRRRAGTRAAAAKFEDQISQWRRRCARVPGVGKSVTTRNNDDADGDDNDAADDDGGGGGGDNDNDNDDDDDDDLQPSIFFSSSIFN